MKNCLKRASAAFLTGTMVVMLAACGEKLDPGENLARNEEEEGKTVVLYVPMERSKPDAENIARTAFDKTVIMAEEKLDLRVEYNTYTSENYQEKSYDDVGFDRIQNHLDDLYLLNPDVLHKTGEEGLLEDLSGLDCVRNLRDVVKMANTVDGKLLGIPQEVVVYGLFVNKDMFDEYDLELPNTPDEFLE